MASPGQYWRDRNSEDSRGRGRGLRSRGTPTYRSRARRGRPTTLHERDSTRERPPSIHDAKNPGQRGPFADGISESAAGLRHRRPPYRRGREQTRPFHDRQTGGRVLEPDVRQRSDERGPYSRGGPTPRRARSTARGQGDAGRAPYPAHANTQRTVDTKDRSWRLRRLQLREIMSMCKLEPEDLMNTLANNVKAFQATLQHNDTLAKPGIMSAIVHILSSLAEKLELGSLGIPSASAPHATQVLAEAFSSRCPNFQLQLKLYVVNLKRSTVHEHYSSRSTPMSEIQKVCTLFRILLTSLPESSWSCLPVDELLESVQHQNTVNPAFSLLVQQATDVVSLRDHVKQAFFERQKSQSSKKAQPVMEWDNSEYRQVAILPQWDEVCIGDPPAKLRENVVHGAYTDWMHYYDIQFRLLREDFVAPLRKGICEYLGGIRGRKLQNVKVYNNVTIVEPLFTKAGICYQLQFDTSRFQRCNWEHSKRLMFGSLVCLSPDDFNKAIYFATVSNRDSKKLAEGHFEVQFEEGARILPLVNSAVFTMVESMAYFEASRHILHSLQTAEVDTMPFTRYLIQGNCDSVSPPQYLVDEDADDYNLNCLYSSSREESPTRNLVLDVQDITQWPTTDEVELDQSQLEAIQMALTQEIAVIQGPPGTGKTYIGLKIVEALLQNRRIWDPAKESPIFVMCLTNHALDQFLEGIMKQPRLHVPGLEDEMEECPQGKTKARIVRIGGRSQSEVIQEFNIERRRRMVYLPGDTLRNKQRLKDMVENPVEICREWQYLRMHLSQSYKNLMYLDHLKPYIDPEHFYQLMQTHVPPPATFQEANRCLDIWLGLYELIYPQVEPPQVPADTEGDLEEAESAFFPQPQHELYNPGFVPHVATAEDMISDKQAEQEPARLLTEQGNVSSEEDMSSTTSESSTEEELIDIQGEASIEEAARMLDNEFQPLAGYILFPDEIPQNPENFSGWHDASYFETEDKGASEEVQKLPTPPKPEYRRQANADEILHWGLQQNPMTAVEADCIMDIGQLQLQNRWRLYNYWVSRKVSEMMDTNENEFHEYNKLCKEYRESCQQADRFSLETADVIGMTTTGAAKYQHILHLVKPKIIIVEEAAEVLESHIVSALNAGTQHLILIGDHKQLRPKLNEYDLVKRFKLDISLFERLIVRGFPHATLQIQHRMRPQIAQLVCPHIYSTLFNHSSVLEYGDVKGVANNLFFVQHEFPEKEDENLISHSNPHEAEYISALCKYLLQQNYRPSQITILVTYSGQLFKVRKQMPKKDFEGVRITTVDNFQGEENDIILISFVRSNSDGKVGYLRENNRVCVALSRAKMGLYCIGNFKMLRENVPIWDRILSDVEQRGCISEELPLHCSSHPDTKSSAKSPEDFAKNAPFGGCNRDCEFRLPCGHVCARKCHITDPTHAEYLCTKPCVKMCPEGHPCPLPCHKGCKQCMVKVERWMPECGHLQLMHCWKTPETVSCKSPCSKKCQNGHPCPLLCYQACRSCIVNIPKTIPRCGHTENVPCYKDPSEHDCVSDCEVKCENGHRCPKRCYQECGDCMYTVGKVIPECGHAITLPCYQPPTPELCDFPCEKTLPCGHYCGLRCGDDCSIKPCRVKVTKELECGHAKKLPCHLSSVPEAIICEKPCTKNLPCGHPCQERCSDPCTEQCMKVVTRPWPCGHKLKRKCYQARDPEKHPCQKQCEKPLPCGHKCTKKCGETCTDKCKSPVDRKYPCGHVNCIPCHASFKEFPCRQKCNTMLKCGHECEAQCSVCYSRRIHQPCKYGIKMTRFCGHDIHVNCLNLDDVHPGKKQCAASCAHTKCSHDCTVNCPPCTEPCAWTCPHYECTKLCHELCDRPPCNERCPHKLKCGHQCFGVCGEPCLTICPLCPKGRKAFKKQLKEAKEFKEDSVYIQLQCRHIFHVEYLDAYVNPKPTGDVAVGPKKCPVADCKQWISTSYRYGNSVKQCLADVQVVRNLLKDEGRDEEDPQELKMNVAHIKLELYRLVSELETHDQSSFVRGPQSLREAGFHKMDRTWYRFKLYPPLTKTLVSLKHKRLNSDTSIGLRELFILQMLLNTIQILTEIEGTPVKKHVPMELGEGVGTVYHNVVTFIKFLELVMLNGCRLSQQLVTDLTCEYYRVVLLAQYSDAVLFFNDVQTPSTLSALSDFLRELQEDPYKRVTKTQFHSHADNPEELDIPSCKIGRWYKCSQGHVYCEPPTRPGMGREASCPQCQGGR